MSKRGAAGHLTPAAKARLLGFIGEGLSSRAIMDMVDVDIRVVQYWRRRSRQEQYAETEKTLPIAQLCFVNGCHNTTRGGKKYCALHERTPGQHGVQSHASMARLMGSR